MKVIKNSYSARLLILKKIQDPESDVLDEFESLVDGRDYVSMHDERDYFGDGADSMGAECELERALGPVGYGGNKIVSKGYCAEFWGSSSGEAIEQEFCNVRGR